MCGTSSGRLCLAWLCFLGSVLLKVGGRTRSAGCADHWMIDQQHRQGGKHNPNQARVVSVTGVLRVTCCWHGLTAASAFTPALLRSACLLLLLAPSQSGGKLLRRLSNFQKTVSCVRMSPLAGPNSAAAPRMLAGSLDGHVKVFELNDFKVTSASKYPAPVLSMGISPDCSLLAVGMADGTLSVRKHARPKPVQVRCRGRWWSYFLKT